MSFYVHVDERTQAVRVHLGRCRWCREGRGMAGTFRERGQAAWHGPFPTTYDALAAARRFGMTDTREAYCCSPRPTARAR